MELKKLPHGKSIYLLPEALFIFYPPGIKGDYCIDSCAKHLNQPLKVLKCFSNNTFKTNKLYSKVRTAFLPAIKKKIK